MQYPDKYRLTTEENLYIAKQELVRSIWSGVRLEGFNMTYPDTQTVLDGGRLTNADPDAIICINNLKRAWRFVLNTLGKPLDLDLLSKINAIVAANDSLEPGALRTGEGAIGGTSFKPPVITEEQARALLARNAEISPITERAIELFVTFVKSHMFWDGNKRTSLLAANKLLIENGRGILLIATEDLEKFNQALHEYYENDNKQGLTDFLYENTISANNLAERGAQRLKEDSTD